MPSAAINTGKPFQIKNIGSGVITIVSTGTNTIDGDQNLILRYQNSAVNITSDGADWRIF